MEKKIATIKKLYFWSFIALGTLMWLAIFLLWLNVNRLF